MSFSERLARAASQNDSLLCVGLDPKNIPAESLVAFNAAIVDATADLVCAYKPNLALYEHLGVDGIKALEETLRLIPGDIPVIGDGKRGDIANCGDAYAERLFKGYEFDAVTVNPYMGRDAVAPFLAWRDRGIFVLCRSSNEGGTDLQELQVTGGDGVQRPLYMEVARLAHDEWNSEGNVGFVVGATTPDAVKGLREAYPHALMLAPGVGAQGGSIELAVKNGMDSSSAGLILSVSRSVIYAHSQDGRELEVGSRDRYKKFAAAARQAAESIRAQINTARQTAPVVK